MIDSKFASEQLTRMSGLNFFPKEREAVKELRLALESAENQPIARRVVDDWINVSTDSPKPAELRIAINTENERAAKPAPPPRAAHCARCGDSGIQESLHAAQLNSIASYCTCHAGWDRQERRDEYSPERVNAARKTLSKKAMRGTDPLAQLRERAESGVRGLPADGYHGEF